MPTVTPNILADRLVNRAEALGAPIPPGREYGTLRSVDTKVILKLAEKNDGYREMVRESLEELGIETVKEFKSPMTVLDGAAILAFMGEVITGHVRKR